MASKTHALSIYLLKPEMRSPGEALRKERTVNRHQVHISARTTGELYSTLTRSRAPRWATLFQGSAEPELDLTQRSASAILFLRTSGRLFALTFGYGRHLLDPGCWEERFGLRATLNSIDPRRIRSMDRLSLDALARQTRTSVSRPAEAVAFGIDVEQDLLRSVTGEPQDPKLGSRLAGRDSLHATVQLDLHHLPDLLSAYLELSNLEDYREHFGWVDHISEIRDPITRASLDSELLRRLRERDLDQCWMSVPEPIEWNRVEEFRYTPKGQGFGDLHLRDFLDSLGSLSSLATLKRRRVLAIDSETGLPRYTWPAYGCIYCEVEEEQGTLLLSGGAWYRVDRDFVGQVNRAVDALYQADGSLPAFRHTSEREYNESVASSLPEYALMDRKLITTDGMADPVEFCDLYSLDGEIIHVKRYGGSSVLSHLFAQGLVSGRLFLFDSSFRTALNKRLPEAHKFPDPEAQPRADQYPVIFAIVSRRRSEFRLPFFSRVNLKNVSQQLQEIGYPVRVVKIERVQED